MKIRFEIDFHPPDGAFEFIKGSSEVFLTAMVQRAFPFLRGEWFDVTILPDAPDAPSADPAVAVPDEALACPALACGPCIARGPHHWHESASGEVWSEAYERTHPFDDAHPGAQTLNRREAP